MIVVQLFAVKRENVALSYTIDKELRLVTTTAWGTLTADQVLEHQRQLQNDPAFDPDFSQLRTLP